MIISSITFNVIIKAALTTAKEKRRRKKEYNVFEYNCIGNATINSRNDK